jgi:hypothetical protein
VDFDTGPRLIALLTRLFLRHPNLFRARPLRASAPFEGYFLPDTRRGVEEDAHKRAAMREVIIAIGPE